MAAGYRIMAGVEVNWEAADTFKHNIAYFQGKPCAIYGGPECGDMLPRHNS